MASCRSRIRFWCDAQRNCPPRHTCGNNPGRNADFRLHILNLTSLDSCAKGVPAFPTIHLLRLRVRIAKSERCPQRGCSGAVAFRMPDIGPSGAVGARSHVHSLRASTILSQTSGFIAEAGFTHSLTPARTCLFGCTYCYVPTLRIFGGLKPADWQHWGRHTTMKTNAAELLRRQLSPSQRIYCSPLVDPYQPAEAQARLMPEILESLCQRPPAVFVMQTRGALILRDLQWLLELSQRTRLRVSFSLTTDRDDVRKLYEPHCDSVEERLRVISRLSDAGIAVYCTLAPLLPCDPVRLAEAALDATSHGVIVDPLHNREGKPRGATTRPEGLHVSKANGFDEWHSRDFQVGVVDLIQSRVEMAGREFGVGAAGFRMLAA